MTDNEVEKPASPTIHVTLILLVSLFVTIIGGSCLINIEIVARGEGRIIPTKRVQLVQPQIDGKITSILVQEGQSVKAGDVLATMETTAAANDVKLIQAGIERQRQEVAVAMSIITPLANKDPTDSNFVRAGREEFQRLSSDYSEQTRGTEALVIAMLSALRDQVAQIDAQLLRITSAKDAQMARLDKARSNQEIVSLRLASTKKMRERGTISEFDYLEGLREFRAAESDAKIAERQLNEFSAEAAATTVQRTSTISAALLSYRKQLNEGQIAMMGLLAELGTAQNRLANLTLTSPTNGRVENLSVFTPGGFVEAGVTIMSIVPSDGVIEVEAFFDNRDIGFLEAGKSAFVKFDAFPAERFGRVLGRVLSVGADAREAATKNWVYAARLSLLQSSIQVSGQAISFVPGMTVTVDVVTGERRLISYFFEPLLKIFQDGLKEQ